MCINRFQRYFEELDKLGREKIMCIEDRIRQTFTTTLIENGYEEEYDEVDELRVVDGYLMYGREDYA